MLAPLQKSCFLFDTDTLSEYVLVALLPFFNETNNLLFQPSYTLFLIKVSPILSSSWSSNVVNPVPANPYFIQYAALV